MTFSPDPAALQRPHPHRLSSSSYTDSEASFVPGCSFWSFGRSKKAKLSQLSRSSSSRSSVDYQQPPQNHVPPLPQPTSAAANPARETKRARGPSKPGSPSELRPTDPALFKDSSKDPSKKSVRSKHSLVQLGHERLRTASDTMYQHRDTLYSQINGFDERWAQLYTVAPKPNKLTKGRQTPLQWATNTDMLLSDVQAALTLKHRLRAPAGFLPRLSSIRSLAKSISSRLSVMGSKLSSPSPSLRARSPSRSPKRRRSSNRSRVRKKQHDETNILPSPPPDPNLVTRSKAQRGRHARQPNPPPSHVIQANNFAGIGSGRSSLGGGSSAGTPRYHTTRPLATLPEEGRPRLPQDKRRTPRPAHPQQGGISPQIYVSPPPPSAYPASHMSAQSIRHEQLIKSAYKSRPVPGAEYYRTPKDSRWTGRQSNQYYQQGHRRAAPSTGSAGPVIPPPLPHLPSYLVPVVPAHPPKPIPVSRFQEQFSVTSA